MDDLTFHAKVAYDTRKDTGFTANPYLYSSPNWYAHELGIMYANTGMDCPVKVRMGRGYSIRESDKLYKIIETRESIRFEVKR